MNIKDIAKELKISVATVSRVINNHKNVKKETREKVLEYIKISGYTPNVIAQNLSKKENKTIALIVPNLTNPFFANMVDSICKIFGNNGYQIALYNSLENDKEELKAIDDIVANRMSAVIAILSKGKYRKNPLRKLEKMGMPVYLLDREIEGIEVPGVFIDNFTGAYNVTKMLLKEGHRKIAMITGDIDFKNTQERVRGFLEAHKDMGIDCEKSNIYVGDYLLESGYIIGKKILKKEYTAVFSANTLMTYGFLKAQREEKKEVELGCFEYIELLDLLGINILSCQIPFDEIGKEMEKIFLENSIEKKYIVPILVDDRRIK